VAKLHLYTNNMNWEGQVFILQGVYTPTIRIAE